MKNMDRLDIGKCQAELAKCETDTTKNTDRLDIGKCQTELAKCETEIP